MWARKTTDDVKSLPFSISTSEVAGILLLWEREEANLCWLNGTESFLVTQAKTWELGKKKSDIDSLKELIKLRSHIIKWHEVLFAICMSYDLRLVVHVLLD